MIPPMSVTVNGSGEQNGRHVVILSVGVGVDVVVVDVVHVSFSVGEAI